VASDGRKLMSVTAEENDHDLYRKRVTIAADGNTVSYEDSKFITAESGAILNVFADLGRFPTQGKFINDGPGKIKIELSFDGITYGGLHTVKRGEGFDLTPYKFKKIRLTWVTNTAYRCAVA
jgi:hypothetical protein